MGTNPDERQRAADEAEDTLKRKVGRRVRPDECPFCTAVPPKRPMTLIGTRDGMYHSHNCPSVRRELAEERAFRIEIGDPYIATDPGAVERHIKWMKKKGWIK